MASGKDSYIFLSRELWDPFPKGVKCSYRGNVHVLMCGLHRLERLARRQLLSEQAVDSLERRAKTEYPVVRLNNQVSHRVLGGVLEIAESMDTCAV